MITAGLFRRRTQLSPKKLSSVSPQNTASMTITRYSFSFAKRGSITYATAAATNDRTVGNQTTFSTHSNQIARNPDRSPKASLTHAYRPPARGHPVASSAATSASGMKNRTAPRT
jgi:hypothetical protein